MKLIHFIFPVIVLIANGHTYAQEKLHYMMPPKAIADVINTPHVPEIILNNQNSCMIFVERNSIYTSIRNLSENELRLAGVRINPLNNFPSRLNPASGLKLKRLTSDTSTIQIDNLPQYPSIMFPVWSPDGKKIAFCQLNKYKVELWLVDIKSTSARRLITYGLNFPLDYNPIIWSGDSKNIYCLIKSKKFVKPISEEIQTGPIIQESDGIKKPTRTLQDLLKNKTDEKLFEYYLTSELIKVDLKGNITKIGEPEVFMSFEVSPDNKYILCKTVQKPYSYKLSVNSFPLKIDIYSSNGNLIKHVAFLPLAEKPLGRDAVAPIPRGHSWQNNAPSTLYWIEPLNEEKADKVINRDKIVILKSPFEDIPIDLYKTQYRYFLTYWCADSNVIVVERNWEKRKMKWNYIDTHTGKLIDSLFLYAFDNAYDAPGEPYLKYNVYNRKVIDIDASNNILLSSYIYSSKHGLIPLLNKFSLKNKTKSVLWQSTPPNIDFFASFVNNNKNKLLYVSQSRNKPINHYIISLKDSTKSKITFNEKYFNMLTSIQRKDIKYKRADGIDLNATLYYPKDFDSTQKPLPTLMWAYPVEYKNKESANQDYNSPYYYLGYSNLQMLLATQGYAVLDYASFPIVGVGNEDPNNSYINQITMNAKAAIDEGVRLGIVDSTRVAVAGHSYGAFLVANLLTHTKMFKTGIAQSGSYNRTLTPFGFQSEYRTYWEAPSLYNLLSPFQNADKLKFPILIIHGDADNNPGTFTFQSDRYFDALQGLGVTARYVKLPFESHVYQSKESILHLGWEMSNWLSKYLKYEEKSKY